MNLLLTGASGFLGRNFLVRANRKYERIVAVYRTDSDFAGFVAGLNNPAIVPIRCDLTDSAQVLSLYERFGHDWDCCLYLAATVDIPWSVREPKQDLLVNTGSLLNVLEPLRSRKFVYFSSGAVYDGLEGAVEPDAKVNPTLPYAVSKLACERYVEFYRQRRRSIDHSLIVRFFGAYGPFEAPHKIYTRLVQALSADAKSYTIYGDGTNLIDAMYVGDAVDALDRMLSGNHWDDIVNLAGGSPVTIEYLVRQVAAALGNPSLRIEKQGIANESNRFWGSTAGMKTLFDFEPKISLTEGIQALHSFLTGRADNFALQADSNL